MTGDNHPLPIYIKAGVPVAISTDDEGVARSDMTHEYLRAVESYHLPYTGLKRMTRQSIEHSFLSGASLWTQTKGVFRPVGACANDIRQPRNPQLDVLSFLRQASAQASSGSLKRRSLRREEILRSDSSCPCLVNALSFRLRLHGAPPGQKPHPSPPPPLPVIAERGGTQLRTPLPVAMVDTQNKIRSPFAASRDGFQRSNIALFGSECSIGGMEDVCSVERKDLSDLICSFTTNRSIS